MTDPITDAVRRIKRLQQDVERLKAGTSEEGEPRLFVSEDDRAVASDESDVRPNDVGAEDTAVASDTDAEMTAESVAGGYWNEAAWNTSEYSDA